MTWGACAMQHRPVLAAEGAQKIALDQIKILFCPIWPFRRGRP